MSSDQYLTENLKNSLRTRGICISVAEYCSGSETLFKTTVRFVLKTSSRH